MKNIFFILISAQLIFNNYNLYSSKLEYNNTIICLNRGIEIRYIVLNKDESLRNNYITIDGLKYDLFKSKEDAINSVKFSNLKKDYTIVYVISLTKKDIEIVTIED